MEIGGGVNVIAILLIIKKNTKNTQKTKLSRTFFSIKYRRFICQSIKYPRLLESSAKLNS
jgi:hypothetical protein